MRGIFSQDGFEEMSLISMSMCLWTHTHTKSSAIGVFLILRHLCATNTQFLYFCVCVCCQIPWIKFQHYHTAFHLSCLVLEWCNTEIKLQKSEIKIFSSILRAAQSHLKLGIMQKVYTLEKEQTFHCSLFIPLCCKIVLLSP